jgi:Domain of unknown function (DUF4328)
MSPPPGYVAYGSTDAASGAFQGVRRISKAMVVLLWIYLPLQLLGILELARLSRQANRFLDGSISEQSFKDSTRAGVGLGGALMVVPIAVLTMIWMYRMSANLRKLGRPGQTWVPGWGIGGWFVPPCAVYAVPWLMFKELWKGSDPAIGQGAANWKQGRVPPLITVWWVLYGLIPIFSIGTNSQFVREINSNDTTRELAQRYHDYAGRSFVFAVLGIAATVVYLMLVRQLSSRHMQATREP